MKKPGEHGEPSPITIEALTDLVDTLEASGAYQTDIDTILVKLFADSKGLRAEDADPRTIFQIAEELYGRPLTDIEKIVIRNAVVAKLKVAYKELGLDEFGKLKKQ